MEEIKINVNGEEKTIKMKNPKGRETKKGFKLMTKIDDGEEVNAEALVNYTDYLDEMAANMADMTVEELDDLEDIEKEKIVAIAQQRIAGKLDFLKSSLKSENSAPKVEKTS